MDILLFGDESEQYGESIFKLAGVLKDMGEYEAAKEGYQKALEI